MYTLMSKRVGVGTNFIRELSGNNILFERDVYVDSNIIYTVGIVVGSHYIGHRSGFITKHDSSGNIVWSKIISNGPETIEPYSMCVDSTGNIYIGGIILIHKEISDPVNGVNINGDICSIIKLNSSGNILWQKKVNIDNIKSVIRDMKIDSTGNIIVCGQLIHGSHYEAGMLIKIDQSGNLLWRKIYGYTANYYYHNFNKLIIDSSNNIYTFGSQKDNSGTSYKYNVAKYNSSGNLLWQKLISPNVDSALVDAIQDDLYLYAIGSWSSSSESHVFKISKNDGSISWTEKINNIKLKSLNFDQNDNIIITGQAVSFPGSLYICCMTKSSGSIIYQKTFTNGTLDSEFSKVISYGGYLFITSSGKSLPNTLKSLLIKIEQNISTNTYGGYTIANASNTSTWVSLQSGGSALNDRTTNYSTPSVLSTSFTTTDININPNTIVSSAILSLHSNSISSLVVNNNDNSLIAAIINQPGLVTSCNIIKYNSSNNIAFNTLISANGLGGDVNLDTVKIAKGSDFIVTVSNLKHPTVDSYNLSVISINESTGGVRWKRKIGNGSSGHCVCVDSNDNIIIASNYGSNSVYIIKIDSNSNILWKESTTYFVTAAGICVDQNNDIYVIGDNNSTGSANAVAIIKISSGGSILRSIKTNNADIEQTDKGTSIIYDPIYDRIYATLSDNNSTSPSSYRDNIICLTPYLDILWKSALNEKYSTGKRFISVDDTGSIYLNNGKVIVKYSYGGSVSLKKHHIPYDTDKKINVVSFPYIHKLASSIVYVDDSQSHTIITRSDTSFTNYLNGDDIIIVSSNVTFSSGGASLTTSTLTLDNEDSNYYTTVSNGAQQYYDVVLPIKLGLDVNIINF